MNTCILIPIVVGLISALLGYLLGKLGNNNNEEVNRLENDLKECKSKIKEMEIENSRIASAMTAPVIAFNAGEAKAIFGKTIKENDLTVIEGIGPKIQELFHNNGVATWKSLSECSVEKCQEVLDSGGEAFTIHNPKTWPEQSKMAYEGSWKALWDWQEELDGGK